MIHLSGEFVAETGHLPPKLSQHICFSMLINEVVRAIQHKQGGCWEFTLCVCVGGGWGCFLSSQRADLEETVEGE